MAVGAGIQTIKAGNCWVAYMLADPDAGSATPGAERTTLSSLDFYYYGVGDAGIGSLDFDLSMVNKLLMAMTMTALVHL